LIVASYWQAATVCAGKLGYGPAQHTVNARAMIVCHLGAEYGIGCVRRDDRKNLPRDVRIVTGVAISPGSQALEQLPWQTKPVCQ
jgi:hypothetical protein